MNTLYGRGVEGWISLEGEGDAEFGMLGTWLMQESKKSEVLGSAEWFQILVYLLACFGAFGFIMLAIFRMNLGKLGVRQLSWLLSLQWAHSSVEVLQCSKIIQQRIYLEQWMRWSRTDGCCLR